MLPHQCGYSYPQPLCILWVKLKNPWESDGLIMMLMGKSFSQQNVDSVDKARDWIENVTN
jgi:hypothetical protein